LAKKLPIEISISAQIDIPPQIRPGFISVGRRLSNFSREDFKIRELYEPSTHLLNSENKKLIRAALVLSGATALGLEPEKFIDLAVAIEMLHNASLIHDDIIDKDLTRRGVPTVHVKYGEPAAILAGNANITKAIKYASRYGGQVVEKASEASLDMCAGELLDYNVQKDGKIPTLDEYLIIIGLKTGSLMGASTSIPATYVGDEQSEKALQEIGYNIGLAFQLRDDILEYLGIKSRESAAPITFRPNIVTVFEGHKKENPVKTAIKLNNFYIGQARERLVVLSNPELFDSYLSFLEIK
jgi:geranylgeranyl diphosphate synthase type I